MQQRKDERHTYADYLTWDDGARYELIDGVPRLMSPAPSTAHQEVSGSIFLQIGNYLKGKPCKVFSAPFDVRLCPDGADDTVVQPDISVVCDPSKLDARGCKGAPDMVVEILSPSTLRQDQFVKYHKYLAAGVREYWLVSPEARGVQVYLLRGGEYVSRMYEGEDAVPVSVLDGCVIALGDVFPPEATDAREEPASGADNG